MVGNLNKQYKDVSLIYEQQKQYRQTSEGKLALRRAKERQILKKMPTLYCSNCDEIEFELLVVVENDTLCYNCKFRRPKVLEEYEICQ